MHAMRLKLSTILHCVGYLDFYIVVIALLCASCTKQIPADWPVPTLSLPAQSKLVRVNIVSRCDFHKRAWYIEFRSRLSGVQVRSHVESCLKPLGYRRSAYAGWEDTVHESYVLSDNSLEVQLVNHKDWQFLPENYKGRFDFAYYVYLNEPLDEGVVLEAYRCGEPL